MIDKKRLPRHVAIIMDGNGRWAKERGLPKIAGHKEGMESLRAAIEYCRETGVDVLTVYAFSTENWSRPKDEVRALVGFIDRYIDSELENFKKNGIRFNCIGRTDAFPASTRAKIKKITEETKGCSRLTFNAALNYGGRAEIIDAVNSAVSEGKSVDEGTFSGLLYTKGQPDPDLLIRTSGEKRVSNFLLWQISYAEFYFTEKLWPDFKKPDLEDAIVEYQRRNRRFGS